jgi:uncharacterized protein (DUF305 family)
MYKAIIFITIILLALVACNGASPADVPTDPVPPELDQEGIENRGTMGEDAPYDARFIDAMTEHHLAATRMAEQALQESERPEIRQMAQSILDAQQREIAQMAQWRQSWYPALGATTAAHDMHMGTMEIPGDDRIPFDQRFITAMIDHHRAAVEMAREAQTGAQNPELQQLAAEIVTAQEAEIAQLEQWQQEWYGP